MKIGVCAKVTPDADARIKISGDGSGIDPTGVKFVVSDYDEYAVEEAIKTKEAHGGEVVLHGRDPRAHSRSFLAKALWRRFQGLLCRGGPPSLARHRPLLEVLLTNF